MISRPITVIYILMLLVACNTSNQKVEKDELKDFFINLLHSNEKLKSLIENSIKEAQKLESEGFVFVLSNIHSTIDSTILVLEYVPIYILSETNKLPIDTLQISGKNLFLYDGFYSSIKYNSVKSNEEYWEVFNSLGLNKNLFSRKRVHNWYTRSFVIKNNRTYESYGIQSIFMPPLDTTIMFKNP